MCRRDSIAVRMITPYLLFWPTSNWRGIRGNLNTFEPTNEYDDNSKSIEFVFSVSKLNPCSSVAKVCTAAQFVAPNQSLNREGPCTQPRTAIHSPLSPLAWFC